MNARDWQKIKDVFALALEQPSELRAAFLRDACDGDVELRAEVESLLAAHEESRPLIERRDYGAVAVFDVATAGYVGKEFGNYKVIREIGRGGMGTVFLAERADGEFQQQVALKLVRRSFDDAELARRFRRERQILASLNHPNIARLLDGSVSREGEPYLVMEYVEGLRVDDYCDGRGLSTAARLRLFLAVCRGVAYAHQNLVVHRDIKPSNILVTADGTPKLLDFGIAKLLDAEHADERTETSFRAFTPDYAAPEQVSGAPVTTGSDVYSLGVLLHDLLHGPRRSPDAQPAVDLWRSESAEGKTIAKNLSAKQERTTAKDGHRLHVGSELKNIIAMARREEPQRRYASVAQLAEDIQRYLDGLPVRAQRDSVTYRAGKFVRRHRVGVAAAALLLLTLLGGVIATVWQARRATAQARIAAEQRDRAQRRFDDVRKLSNSLLFEITPKIEPLEGSTEAREVLVKRALEYLDSLSQEAGDDLQLQSELAAAYEKIGSLQGEESRPNLGDYDGAVTSYEKAQAIRRKLLQALRANVENRRLLAESLRSLAKIRLAQRNEFARALEHYAEASRIYEDLTRESPSSLKLQTAHLEMRLEQAQSYGDKYQYDEAIPPLRQAIGELEELRRKHHGEVEVSRVLAKGLAYLGTDLAWNNQQAEAEPVMARGITIAESLVVANPTDANLRQRLWAHYHFAANIYAFVDSARSFELADKALKVVEETIALDRANTQARTNLAKTLSLLGLNSANLGKSSEALVYLERSARVWLELLDKDPRNTTYNRNLAVSYQTIGDAKYKRRELADALGEYEKAAAIYEKLYAVDQEHFEALRDIAGVRKSIGLVHDDLARAARGEKRSALLQKAKENYEQALDILLTLQSTNALAEFDRKFLEEMQAAVQKYKWGS